MALAAEVTFVNAVAAAEGIRQVTKAAALATYGYVQANLAAYIAALAAADVAYITAVNTAANSSGLTLGNAGQSGPLGGRNANIVNIGD
jgi:hypothetical protein